MINAITDLWYKLLNLNCSKSYYYKKKYMWIDHCFSVLFLCFHPPSLLLTLISSVNDWMSPTLKVRTCQCSSQHPPLVLINLWVCCCSAQWKVLWRTLGHGAVFTLVLSLSSSLFSTGLPIPFSSPRTLACVRGSFCRVGPGRPLCPPLTPWPPPAPPAS